MKKAEIKTGLKVEDKGFPLYGCGIITEVLKTRFKVKFEKYPEPITYDYPHGKFLNEIKPYKAVAYVQGGGTIVPMDENLVSRVGFTFLHGKLEDLAGYDIFGFVGEKPSEEGIYDVITIFPDKEVKSTLFLWKSNEVKGLQGLCVANDDQKYFQDAQDKFNKKEYSI